MERDESNNNNNNNLHQARAITVMQKCKRSLCPTVRTKLLQRATRDATIWWVGERDGEKAIFV